MPNILRYAHSSFAEPQSTDIQAEAVSTSRTSSSARSGLGELPPLTGVQVMKLADIIGDEGVNEIIQAGALRFHAVGDTSGSHGESNRQEEVSEDMALDFHPSSGGYNPAFFFHLGDVIYGAGKEELYRDGFYRAYRDYPGKIVAIPGNHDGEVNIPSDPESLRAFRANFCAPTSDVPQIASDIGIERQMVAQPGVYWLLDAPFAQIIGLYSNRLEDQGSLHGANNDESQIGWLRATLNQIATDRANGNPSKALIIATHHPPYSSGGHSGSSDMLATIDAACQEAGIMYDALLSGHAHNYQRYTRRGNFNSIDMEIPFIVAGGGGHGLQAVEAGYGLPVGDHIYNLSLKAYGYLLITVTASRLTIEQWEVPSSSTRPFDVVNVDLRTHQLI